MADRTFEFLLNAMEMAAQSPNPAQNGYAGKRRAVLDYVAQVERDRDDAKRRAERAERAAHA